MAKHDELDIWNFITFPLNVALVEPTKPNLPLPSGWQIFLQASEEVMEKYDIFRKNSGNKIILSDISLKKL